CLRWIRVEPGSEGPAAPFRDGASRVVGGGMAGSIACLPPFTGNPSPLPIRRRSRLCPATLRLAYHIPVIADAVVDDNRRRGGWGIRLLWESDRDAMIAVGTV